MNITTKKVDLTLKFFEEDWSEDSELSEINNTEYSKLILDIYEKYDSEKMDKLLNKAVIKPIIPLYKMVLDNVNKD